MGSIHFEKNPREKYSSGQWIPPDGICGVYSAHYDLMATLDRKEVTCKRCLKILAKQSLTTPAKGNKGGVLYGR